MDNRSNRPTSSVDVAGRWAGRDAQKALALASIGVNALCQSNLRAELTSERERFLYIVQKIQRRPLGRECKGLVTHIIVVQASR